MLGACLDGLRELHEALDEGEARLPPGQRTLVRDGGFWSPQLELDLDTAGYGSLISLPLGHKAAEEALQRAVRRGAMKRLSGKLSHVRAARERTAVGKLDRTLVVVESEELLEGQKRGIALAPCAKRRWNCAKLERLTQTGRLSRSSLEHRVRKALAREHLSSFVVTTICWKRQNADVALARRCRPAPPTGEDPARSTGAVHGSTPLEHGSDCARFPRSVERRGAVP